jgi:hypothetical protein
MMIVAVRGSNPELVGAVRAGLHQAGYTQHALLPTLPWTVDITVEYTDGAHVVLDSVDGPFERMLLKALEQYTTTGAVLLMRRGGVRQDRHCALGIPPGDVAQVVRALSWALHVVPTARKPWYKRLWE